MRSQPHHIDLGINFFPKHAAARPNNALDDYETASGGGEGSELDTLRTLCDLSLPEPCPVDDVCVRVRVGGVLGMTYNK